MWMRINKMDLKNRIVGHGMDLTALGYGQVTCFCEQTSDRLSSIIYGEFLDHNFITMKYLHGSQLHKRLHQNQHFYYHKLNSQ